MKKIVKLSLILVVLSLFSINLFSISVSASECGDFFKENEFMTNSDLSYEIISDNGTNYTRIYLNVKNDVTLNSGEIAYFTYTPEADFYFVVETIGDYDTKLRVENTATGTIINDDSCGNLNAKVEFKGLQGKPVYISTKFFSSSTSGSFTLQLRKQRFSMFGYDDGHGHSTISDLKIPYNAFKSIFESIKYENGSSWEAFANDDRDLARINSEIMFFTGHGYKNDEDNKGFGVSFHTGGITTNDRFLNMKKTKVAMWAACYSANSTNPGNISIAEFSVRHGAQSAVGFSEAVEFSSSKTFTNRFFTKLASGATVKEAAKYGAEGLLWPWDNGKKYVIFGNEEMRVTDSSPTISSFSMRNSNLSIIDNLGDDYEYI
ncbi:MAG: CHAT domain-containing protein, partial [Anaeroplasmataceae bacterium]|nr:CHAT domain-containing protein [Anaeroplasmataceae bacterium]